MSKPSIIPPLTTDAEAEAFLGQDLSGLDVSAFRPVRFEFADWEPTVNIRVPPGLLAAIQVGAAARGVPCQRFMLEVSNEAVGGRGGGISL